MDTTELKQKPETELKAFLTECREKLRTLRFELAANRLKNTKEILKLRRTVARTLTVLGQKNQK